MAEINHHHAGNQPGHEESTVNAWAVGKFAIALTLITIASLGLLMGLFYYFLSLEGGSSKMEVKMPPAPQLQRTPVADLRAVRAGEDQALNSYGWVDQGKNIVHIPIDRAIDLLVQKGLPSRAQMPAPSTVSTPNESGLGAMPAPEAAK